MAEGLVVAGRYRLASKLGEGGMGSVWLAEDSALGTPVAIKLIDPSIADSPDAVARFKQEAHAAAALRSAHVVQILDCGVDDGRPYIAMELLHGENLGTRLARVGRLPPGELVAVLTGVSKALGRAHERGIVHRDLKPDNIFLVQEGEDEIVKVLDFGIAKRTDPAAKLAVATRTGSMLGTPHYMSPEQASGKRAVDPRSDIWAMGVIAFECLTGARPFDSDTLGGMVMAICADPIPVPSEIAPVPAGFDGWFARACHRDPESRFQTAADALSELRPVCGPAAKHSVRPAGPSAPAAAPRRAVPAVTAMPTSVTLHRAGHRRGRRPLLFVAGALLVSALGVGAARLVRSAGSASPSASGGTAAPVTPVSRSASPEAPEIRPLESAPRYADSAPAASSPHSTVRNPPSRPVSKPMPKPERTSRPSREERLGF